MLTVPVDWGLVLEYVFFIAGICTDSLNSLAEALTQYIYPLYSNVELEPHKNCVFHQNGCLSHNL